jgi:MFS transporter, PAT family, beta-lactamase induction signal transducer AmpG
MSDIGLVAKNAGLWASVAGGLLAGLWMVRIGINRGLWLFGVVQLASILGFALLAWVHRPDKVLLAGVIAFEALGVGLGTAAFTAYIARATNPRYTATQFALFTSLAVVPRSLVNASTGWIVERIGWVDFYLLCTLLAVPGMALLLRVAPWNEKSEDPSLP